MMGSTNRRLTSMEASTRHYRYRAVARGGGLTGTPHRARVVIERRAPLDLLCHLLPVRRDRQVREGVVNSAVGREDPRDIIVGQRPICCHHAATLTRLKGPASPPLIVAVT
jgi:hypothetical protein